MKKAILIWVGLMFLLFNTRITGVIKYPEYIPFDTPAPNTVDMVIGHVIGDSVPLDLFSDVMGFLLILFAAGTMPKGDKKTMRTLVLAGIALVLYLAKQFFPFFLNGEARYATGYFLYIGYELIKSIVTIQAGLVCCRMAESMENHAWNNVVAIFLILAAVTGFIRGLCFFYDLPKTMVIYFGLQIFFSVLYTVMYWKHRACVRDSVQGTKN